MGDQQRFFIFSDAISRSDTGLAIADWFSLISGLRDSVRLFSLIWRLSPKNCRNALTSEGLKNILF